MLNTHVSPSLLRLKTRREGENDEPGKYSIIIGSPRGTSHVCLGDVEYTQGEMTGPRAALRLPLQ